MLGLKCLDDFKLAAESLSLGGSKLIAKSRGIKDTTTCLRKGY